MARRLRLGRWRLVGAGIAGWMLAAGASLAQFDFTGVEVKAHPVGEGIYMLIGAGGNIGVSVGEDGVFLIDDEFPTLTDKVRAAVAGVSDKPIQFVVNTHWHGDHSGGNEELGKGGVVIVAHDNVRQRMSTEQFNELFNWTTPPSPAVALPVVTFAESVTFHLNGQEIYAFHVAPAHTDGDTVVHLRTANVVHTGDIYFNGMYPFIDIWSGGSVDGYIAAVEQVLGIVDDETKIIPGHGPLATRGELATYLAMLKDVRAKVGALAEAGKSLDETQAAKPTAAYDEQWGQGFIKPEQFVAIVHKDLSSR